jgi:esterase/lipase superfamily enzyme
MQREYHVWRSPNLDREMELLVFGHAGAKVLVFPTRGGRFHEYEDLGIVEAVQPKIDGGHLQLFCIDGLDRETFYARRRPPVERIARHLAYERYVLDEVLPFMGTLNPHPCTIAHGCSLGAFFAASLAFRHPRFFQKLAAFSGRYDLTHPVEHFRDLLDGHRDPDVYYLMPSQFLPRLTRPDLLGALRALDLVFVIGDTDPFLTNNQELAAILAAKHIPHRLHVWSGRAHDARHWRQMAAHHL